MSVQPIIEHLRLPDDSEEDLVGTDWHQGAIVQIYDAILDVAMLSSLPWHVGNQLTLVAWSPSGSVWRPSPDLMVHPEAGPTPRKEMIAAEDGVPALVIEVASESTWRYDIDTVRGKAAGYLALASRIISSSIPRVHISTDSVVVGSMMTVSETGCLDLMGDTSADRSVSLSVPRVSSYASTIALIAP